MLIIEKVKDYVDYRKSLRAIFEAERQVQNNCKGDYNLQILKGNDWVELKNNHF